MICWSSIDVSLHIIALCDGLSKHGSGIVFCSLYYYCTSTVADGDFFLTSDITCNKVIAYKCKSCAFTHRYMEPRRWYSAFAPAFTWLRFTGLAMTCIVDCDKCAVLLLLWQWCCFAAQSNQLGLQESPAVALGCWPAGPACHAQNCCNYISYNSLMLTVIYPNTSCTDLQANAYREQIEHSSAMSCSAVNRQ